MNAHDMETILCWEIRGQLILILSSAGNSHVYFLNNLALYVLGKK